MAIKTNFDLILVDYEDEQANSYPAHLIDAEQHAMMEFVGLEQLDDDSTIGSYSDDDSTISSLESAEEDDLLDLVHDVDFPSSIRRRERRPSRQRLDEMMQALELDVSRLGFERLIQQQALQRSEPSDDADQESLALTRGRHVRRHTRTRGDEGDSLGEEDSLRLARSRVPTMSQEREGVVVDEEDFDEEIQVPLSSMGGGSSRVQRMSSFQKMRRTSDDRARFL
jgi:hypothetical protein